MSAATPYLPPGQLVDVGGFDLHLRCEGEGRPTVIIETGLGDHMESWTGVQLAAAQHTRVCLYDRAGAGWSDSDKEAPTFTRMVRNLRVLLDRAAIEGPYVLVAHSHGGLLVRRFAAEYRDDVVAVLLIESSHENQVRRMSEALAQATLSDLGRKRFCQVESPVSIVRASGLVNAYLAIWTPENLRPMLPAAINQTRYCATVRDEARVFQQAASQVEPPSSLDELPLIVLTASRGMSLDPRASQMGMPLEAIAEWDALWLELQGELAELSNNSEHRIVSGAGHFIQLDRPDVVVESIHSLLTMTRCGWIQAESTALSTNLSRGM
jgi:pimeloyl-ACP methyl ester carboxylesterase